MKLFISADIEGTCGIAHWDETEYGRNGYEYFRRQMTKEVEAACLGACAGGAEEITVKDAHDSARNILPDGLPECATLFRGWAKHPYCMMYGLDETYDGVFLTGYHNAAGTNTNPLAHTMDLSNVCVRLNGKLCPEAMINGLTAAMLGVPVLMLTGDEGLCRWINEINPHIRTVAVNRGTGDGSASIHPALAVRRIRETAQSALAGDRSLCMFPMPDTYRLEIDYVKHSGAYSASFYPGARLAGPKTVAFESDNWWDALRFIHFVL